MKALLITFAVTASIATAAIAQESPAAPDAAAPAATTPKATDAPDSKRDPNARVCKTTPVIGSRVPSRVCMTRAEWVARAKADRADLETAQRSGLATCGTKPCS